MKKIKYFLIILILIISYSFTFATDPVEKIVAKVNDGIITLSELEEFSEGFIKNNFVTNTPESKRKLLDLLVEYELIQQIGEKYNVIVSDSEVYNHIDDTLIKLNNLGSREELEEILIQQNVSPSLYAFIKEQKKMFILQGIARSIMDMNNAEIKITKPSSEEIRTYYEENSSLFILGEERKISHLVLSAGTTRQEYREANELAQTIVEKIQNEEATFEEMAKEYSIEEESKYDGGLLGYFTKEQLRRRYPFYAEIVFFSKKNSLEIVVTTETVNIVSIDDIKEGREQSFSEVYNFIKNGLFLENFQKEFPIYLEYYKSNSTIEILL